MEVDVLNDDTLDILGFLGLGIVLCCVLRKKDLLQSCFFIMILFWRELLDSGLSGCQARVHRMCFRFIFSVKSPKAKLIKVPLYMLIAKFDMTDSGDRRRVSETEMSKEKYFLITEL